MLVVMLIDAFADRLFAATADAQDRLAFRDGLVAQCPALGTVFALAGGGAAAPQLVTEAVEVPLAAYGQLSVADFMVSLYNGHTVQRVLIAMPDGARLMVHDVLDAAHAALAADMQKAG